MNAKRLRQLITGMVASIVVTIGHAKPGVRRYRHRGQLRAVSRED